MPKSLEQIIKRFKKVAEREGRSHSEILRELMLDYLQKHEHGNPQKPLFPNNPVPPPEYSKLPVVRRKEVMEDLIETIRKNEGVDMLQLSASFSHASGLRRETILEYLRTLLMAGKIIRKGNKLYVQ